MRLFIFVLSCLGALCFEVTSAQQTTIIGSVYDENKKAIPFANIVCINNQRIAAATNEKGSFTLSIKLPNAIEISHLGYTSQIKNLRKIPGNDTLMISFILKQSATKLREVTINATTEIETVADDYNLLDFEIKNDNIWLLLNNKKNDFVRISSVNGTLLTQTKLPFNAALLNKTYNNSIYFKSSSDSVYFYDLDTTAYSFLRIDYDEFKNQINPLLAYNVPFYYSKSSDPVKASVTFYAYDGIYKKWKRLYFFSRQKFETEKHK